MRRILNTRTHRPIRYRIIIVTGVTLGLLAILIAIKGIMPGDLIFTTITVSGVFVITTAIYRRNYSRKDRDWAYGLVKKDPGRTLIVLTTIYGFIAAFAITQALTGYQDILHHLTPLPKAPIDLLLSLGSSPQYVKTTSLVIIFFLVATTCILGTRGQFFLSHESKLEKGETQEEKNAGKEAKRAARFLFLTLFLSSLQVTFLYFMAGSLPAPGSPDEISYSNFTIWLFLTQFINLSWVIWSALYASRNDKVPEPPYEWIPINAATAVFLAIGFHSSSLPQWPNYLSLLIVIVGNTGADLVVAWWRVYFPTIREVG